MLKKIIAAPDSFKGTVKAEEFGREVMKAKEENINLILPSISRQEHRSYAIALGIPYGEGSLYGESLSEEEFLEVLEK